jgi:molybdate transport system ATP-binding protein
LDHVGLSAEQQSRRPAALSGGQQQRVAMARALAREPRLLLLDEPFSAVDQMSRQSLYRLLVDLRRELSIPIVLVTHDLNEARLLADRMAVMDGGQILQVGTPASIHQSPRSARVADLVGIQNRFQGLWLGPSAVPGLGQLRWLAQAHATEDSIVLTVRDKNKLPVGHAVNWIIPNDGITLLDQSDVGPHDFAARVVQARYLGDTTLLNLALESLAGPQLVLTLTGSRRQDLPVGAAVHVRLDPERVNVMPLSHP